MIFHRNWLASSFRDKNLNLLVSMSSASFPTPKMKNSKRSPYCEHLVWCIEERVTGERDGERHSSSPAGFSILNRIEMTEEHGEKDKR